MGAAFDDHAVPQPANGVASDRTTVRLDIVTDLVCPFAYIGHLKIAKAIEAAQKAALPIDVVVHHLPFQLDPTLPDDHSINRDEHTREKLGDKYQPVIARVREQGATVGWSPKQGGKVRQTTNVHRLLMLAYQKGGSTMQYPLMASLYTGFWDDLQDPGDLTFLAHEAVKADLFPAEEEALAWLQGNELRNEVKAACQQLRAKGIKGVPFTIINGKYAICGAQDSEDILATFRKIVKGELKCPGYKTSPRVGATCTPKGSPRLGGGQSQFSAGMHVVSTGAACCDD